MYRFLTKFIVACLVLLGDSAFAAEYRYDSKNRNTVDNYSSQLALSTRLEQACTNSSSSYTALDLVHTTQCAGVFSSLSVDHSGTIPNQLNHSLFFPRAPPLHCNTI